MKLLGILLVFIPTLGFCQPLEEGDWVVEAGFGFPNVPPITSSVSFFHGNSVSENSEQRKFGQFYLKTDFFVSDKVSVIGSANYGYFYQYEVRTLETYDGNTDSWVSQSYFYETKLSKWRVTAGINWHLIRTDRLDSYFGVMAGTKKAFTKFNTNDPDAGTPFNWAVPFALRLHWGSRYFITEAIGLNFELGLGGPLIKGGLTYKILKY